MKIKHEYVVCDVCKTNIYSTGGTTEIKFSRNEHEYSFDSCYSCLTGGRMRQVYKKIVDLMKGQRKA